MEYKVWLQNDIQEMDHFKTRKAVSDPHEELISTRKAFSLNQLRTSRIRTMDFQQPGLSEMPSILGTLKFGYSDAI